MITKEILESRLKIFTESRDGAMARANALAQERALCLDQANVADGARQAIQILLDALEASPAPARKIARKAKA